MGTGKVLGSVSPLAGAITGKGAFGKGLTTVGDAMGPAAGFLPMLASQMEMRRGRRATNREEAAAAQAEANRREAIRRSVSGMKKGGKVKAKTPKKMAKGGTASKRADGCATKGKTKGKMV